MFKTLQSNGAGPSVASVVPMQEGHHLMFSAQNVQRISRHSVRIIASHLGAQAMNIAGKG